MSFRKIRPSFGESSASASNPSQSTSESTGPDPRQTRGETSSRDGESNQNSSKRRRVPESVTRNACLNCKKARAKCDGKTPCKRCASRVETSECIYEVHIKHAKEELVRQIKDLKAKNHLSEQVLQALSTDEKVPEILERLRKGDSYQIIVEWLGRSPVEEDTALPKALQPSIFEPPDLEMGGTNHTSFRWTDVTSNSAVLDHLFQLYFAWIHPVHTLFSEGHFVDSYKRQSDEYCSESLVNALCAMACHLHTQVEGDEVDFDQLCQEFSEAVRNNIDPEDNSITTVQTFAVLFLVDCAQGKALRGSAYLNMATNILSNITILPNDGFSVVLMNTICGLRNLNVEWAQITFQMPLSFDTTRFTKLDAIDEQLDDAQWYFYRYVNDQCPAWPGLLATTNREKSKLIVIIDEMCTMTYSQKWPKRSANDVLRLYGRLLSWHQDLPSEIKHLESSKGQALPHVLSLLILYECTIIQLLRPLLDLEGFPSALIEEGIWNHVQYGLFLFDKHYRRKYTCRYQPVLQMFSVLHFCDLVARFYPNAVEVADMHPKDGAQAIQFGLECLNQSRTGFPVAGALQEMLRKTAIECSVRLPKNFAELVFSIHPPLQAYRMDDLIDACTRATYAQPVARIHRRYMPSFAADWVVNGAAFGFREPDAGARRLRTLSLEERGAQSLMQIHNLLNTD